MKTEISNGGGVRTSERMGLIDQDSDFTAEDRGRYQHPQEVAGRSYVELEQLVLKAIDDNLGKDDASGVRTLPRIKKYIGLLPADDVDELIIGMELDRKIRRESNGTITAFFRYETMPRRFWLGGDGTVGAEFVEAFAPSRPRTIQDENEEYRQKRATARQRAAEAGPRKGRAAIEIPPVAEEYSEAWKKRDEAVRSAAGTETLADAGRKCANCTGPFGAEMFSYVVPEAETPTTWYFCSERCRDEMTRTGLDDDTKTLMEDHRCGGLIVDEPKLVEPFREILKDFVKELEELDKIDDPLAGSEDIGDKTYVRFADGSRLAVAYEGNMFMLSPADREFVRHIADLMQSYNDGCNAPAELAGLTEIKPKPSRWERMKGAFS